MREFILISNKASGILRPSGIWWDFPDSSYQKIYRRSSKIIVGTLLKKIWSFLPSVPLFLSIFGSPMLRSGTFHLHQKINKQTGQIIGLKYKCWTYTNQHFVVSYFAVFLSSQQGALSSDLGPILKTFAPHHHLNLNNYPKTTPKSLYLYVLK